MSEMTHCIAASRLMANVRYGRSVPSHKSAARMAGRWIHSTLPTA